MDHYRVVLQKENVLKKVVIFGNSGSGKSTLAKELSELFGVAHLDLDTIAWSAAALPERRAIEESKREIDEFIASNEYWVIEGCYADLLAFVVPVSNELIFLDLPVEQCVLNARNRPWEPHKYESKEAQDANLEMLVNWIADYPTRNDAFSRSAHKKLFDEYAGKKARYVSNARLE